MSQQLTYFIINFAVLRKLATIVFLSVFLCANTEVGQLLKIPVLVHHYFEHHHDRDDTLSFLGFLHKHYSEEDNHSSHNSEHERLPFKSHDAGFSQIVFVYQSPVSFEFRTVVPTGTKDQRSPFNVAFNVSSHLAKIWQPPKSC